MTIPNTKKKTLHLYLVFSFKLKNSSRNKLKCYVITVHIRLLFDTSKQETNHP